MTTRHTLGLTALSLAVGLMLTLGSCSLEDSDNGDLDGMWHLRAVDTLATGGTYDKVPEYYYWCVQGTLLVLENKENSTSLTAGNYIFSFDHSGDSLRLYDPHVFSLSKGDPELTDVEGLRPYGINALDETFVIETLTGSHMVLVSEELRLHLKKF